MELLHPSLKHPGPDHMGQLMAEHLESLREYPPVQGGKSFDMSNIVEEFTKKSLQ